MLCDHVIDNPPEIIISILWVLFLLLFRRCCVQLFCDPMDCSVPGFSGHGISQEEYWSELPFPSLGDLSDPGIEPVSPALQADSLLLSHQGSPVGVITQN